MLGAGVQPGMFTQDYSGFARAGEIQGQAIANLGQQIGGMISNFAAMKKETSQLNAQAKAGEEYLKAASTMYKDNPEISGYIENMLSVANAPNVSPLERSTMLSETAQGIKTFSDFSMKQAMFGLKQQQLGIQQQQMNQGSAAAGGVNPVNNTRLGK